MILQHGGLITGRQKGFIIKDQSQNARIQKTESRSQNKISCQKDIMSNSCRAQQRLMNLTTKSKIKDVQPKLLTESSVRKNPGDPKPPFIYKVQNYEHINSSKSEGKLRNPVMHNGCYEYYPKDPVSDSDFTVKKTIQNGCEVLNENCIKEKLINGPQTINRDLHLSTVYSNTEKKPDNYKNIKKFENTFMGTSEKIKAVNTSENDLSCVIGNNLTSEKADLTDSTSKRFQQWFVKNENDPQVSKVYRENSQIVAKSRPLKISEALELHERENELDLAYKTDSSSKINAPKDRFFSSCKDNLPKFENLQISELHENFLVEKLENPIKSSRNFSIEDEIDCNNEVSIEVCRTDDKISEFLSCDDVSTKFTDLPKNSLSRADHDSFRSRNSSNGHQKFSISTKNYEKDDIQKSSSRSTASQTNLYVNKRNGPTKNIFTNSRNCADNCNKSRSLLSLDYSNECNNNRFTGLSNEYNSMEKKNNHKAACVSSSENFLSSPKDLSFTTPKKNFISEKEDMGMRNCKGFKQWSGRNPPAESNMFTKDTQSSRRYLLSKFHNDSNDKRFSDSCLPIKDQSIMKKLPNSKVMSSKSDVDNLRRNSSHQSVSWTGFQQKQQCKELNDSNSGSALTSVNPAHQKSAKMSYLPSSKDLFKEYNTSHQQQTFKYAKNCSDFSRLMKSSYNYPAGKDTTQNYSCLAQQRLLCCKSLKT